MIQNALPSHDLKDFVLNYQCLSFYFPVKVEQHFAAHTSFWMVVPLGDSIEAHHSPTSRKSLKLNKPYLFASNFQSQPMFPMGNFQLFGIELTPAGMHSLLGGIPGENIVNKIILVEDFFPSFLVNELQDRMKEEPNFKTRIHLVELFLRNNMCINKEALYLPAFVSKELIKYKGRISTKEISSKAGVSEQYLRRKFKEVAGVSPKFHARIIRFNNMIRELEVNQKYWMDLVEKYGYFDQSHLIKDFKAFTGGSPQLFDSRGYELNMKQLNI